MCCFGDLTNITFFELFINKVPGAAFGGALWAPPTQRRDLLQHVQNGIVRPSFTEAKWRTPDFQPEIGLLLYFMQIWINYTIFRRPRGKETYCRDETDPIALSGVSGFVADSEIGEMAKWRMAILGKTA